MPFEYLTCRDMGHAWKPYTVDRERRMWMSTMLCGRCGSFKVRTISSQGRLVKSNMQYADGYLIAGWGVMSAEDKAKMRLALLTRLAEEYGSAAEA